MGKEGGVPAQDQRKKNYIIKRKKMQDREKGGFRLNQNEINKKIFKKISGGNFSAN